MFKQKRKSTSKEFVSSDDEDEQISLIDSSGDADTTDFCPQLEPSAFEELYRDPEPGDFVLVKFTAKK